MTDPIVRTKTLEFLLTEQLADLERAMRGGTAST
jgi:hypothetical protein